MFWPSFHSMKTEQGRASGPQDGKGLSVHRKTNILFVPFCIFTGFAFYTFGRLWFSEIICLGVNH